MIKQLDMIKSNLITLKSIDFFELTSKCHRFGSAEP
jgi:hypothetical protein